jgi:serine/threonine-protein kinase
MRQKGPLLTLLTGGALAAGLLVASIAATAGGPAEDPSLASGATPSAEPAPSPPAETSPPEPEPELPAVTYVGSVDGGGASVAIIVDGDDTIAYVCDGASVEAWLQGSADAGELDLTGDGGSLIARYDDQQAVGETTVAGRTWTFTIEEVANPEGLYRFADTVVGGAEVVGGWIVLPDGTQVGVLAVDGEPQPAPRLNPETGEVLIDGQVVTAQRQG